MPTPVARSIENSVHEGEDIRLSPLPEDLDPHELVPPAFDNDSFQHNGTAILDLVPADADGQRKTLQEIYETITAEQLKPKQRFHHIMYGTPALPEDAKAAFLYNLLHIGMIIVSVALFVFTSLPEIYSHTIQTSGWEFVIESITVSFFTLDFFLRLAAANNWNQVLRLSTFVDFASFIGYYIELILAAAADTTPDNETGFVMLRVLRLFRVFRLFKLSRSHRGLAMMVQVVEKSRDGLLLLFFLVLIAMLVFSSVLYYIELIWSTFDAEAEVWYRDDGTRSPFQSIPHTFWFISVSITTVGYGREYPVTLAGRSWVIVVMLFGVLVLSFPNILIGSNFSAVHRSNTRTKARRRLGVWFRRVRMVIRFIRMWREFRVKGKVTLFIDDPPSMNSSFAGSRRRHSLIPGSPTNSAGSPSPQRFGSLISPTLKAVGHGTGFGAKKLNNFMFSPAEFPNLKGMQAAVSRMHGGNIEEVNLCGISVLNFLQRLLEGFSCCGTIDELAQSYICYPWLLNGKVTPVRKDTLFEVACYTSAANLTTMFVLNRDEHNALILFTTWGIDVLQNFPESQAMPCMRCYSEARDVWAQTVKSVPHNFLPIDGYKHWQKVQKQIQRRSVLDFTYDMKQPESRRNDIFANIVPPQFRRLSHRFLETPAPNDVTLPAALDIQTQPASALGSGGGGDGSNSQLLGNTLNSRNGGGGGATPGCSCRYCSLSQGPGGLGDTCFDADEEYLELEVQLAKARLEAFRLVKKLGQEGDALLHRCNTEPTDYPKDEVASVSSPLLSDEDDPRFTNTSASVALPEEDEEDSPNPNTVFQQSPDLPSINVGQAQTPPPPKHLM